MDAKKEEAASYAALLDAYWLDVPVREDRDQSTDGDVWRFRSVLLACAVTCVTVAVVLGLVGELA